ncbi:hypothetical protein [Paenibacillus marinisediminis]
MDEGHKKFLKLRDFEEYKIGKYIPLYVELFNSSSKDIDIISLDISSKAGVIFFVSTFCITCDFEVVEQIINKYSKFNFTIFLESSEEQYKEVQYKFPNTQIFYCDINYVTNQFEVYSVPWVLGINSIGQIVGGGVLYNFETGINIISPLIKAYYTTETEGVQNGEIIKKTY